MNGTPITMTKEELTEYIKRMLDFKDVPLERLDLIYNLLLYTK